MNPYEPIRDERTREQRVGEYKAHQRLVAFRSRRRRAVRRFPKHLRPIRWTIYNTNSALWALRKELKNAKEEEDRPQHCERDPGNPHRRN